MSGTRQAGGHESLGDWGRRLVGASAQAPREALGFLGRPVRGRRPPQGAVPGEMALPAGAPEPRVCVLSYAAGVLEEQADVAVADLAAIAGRQGRTAWIDVEGFGSRSVLEQIGEVLGIHALALADVVHVPQRPKAELYDDRLLVITQMARVTPEGDVDVEQVGFVLGPGWVASFQERPGDVFDPVRARIRSEASRMRHSGPDYLLYSLIDAVIDGYFPVVEALGGVVEALEDEVFAGASRTALARIHATRRMLLTLHRIQWRQRDAIGVLLRDDEMPISAGVRPYLRDAHDHAFQTLDAIETYRDMVVGLMDLHLSSASHRLNEVMKTLTIVATVFIPLTFLTGVYGMNFDRMPELHWRWGYALVWAAMLVLGGSLLAWFRRRGWLGAADGEG